MSCGLSVQQKKGALACTNGRQKVKCISDEEEYTL
jgi:hypothetical protein